MSQGKDVAAMRVRLQRRGYGCVRVERLPGCNKYVVQAVEPLACTRVRLVVSGDEVGTVGRW